MTFVNCCDSTLIDNLSHCLTLPSLRPLACSSLQLVFPTSTFQLPLSTSYHGRNSSNISSLPTQTPRFLLPRQLTTLALTAHSLMHCVRIRPTTLTPYTTSPYTPPPQHTPPQPAPPSQPEFPPPPPPPLPTADPVTPPPSSYKHSPPPPPAARTGTTPAPPPPHIPSPTPPIHDSWNQTDHHWDSNTLHGHQLYRAIQPTQWSRKAGVAGLPTFDIFPWQLAYHGTAEFTARILSNGKFTAFIATRSIAESVFVTHLLQELREKRLDLDGIAETLHTKQGTDIPSKTTQARAFHAPLINLLIQQLQSHSPAPAEGTALRALKNTTDRPHHPPTPVPLTQSTFHFDPPYPIHRPCRSHLCHWPYPHHTPFRISFQHPSLTTVAQPFSPAQHPTPHLPLPQLPLLQFGLHQAPLQP